MLGIRRPLIHKERVKVDYSIIITIEPNKRNGQPCIRGLRMTVKDVLEYLAGGMTPQEILDDFPDLTAEDIQACLAYATDRLGQLSHERRVGSDGV